MRRVLALYYTQTGQLRDILHAVTGPLEASEEIVVDLVELRPATPYPFPWPFWRFFNTFPETVYEDPASIEPPMIDPNADYDLVILAYQVWFLSPALPVTAFLTSDLAARLLKDRPVMTLIGCRNMWLMAQERVKAHLDRIGARLIDNAVLTDESHSAFTFISTPLWMLTGKRGPFLGGRIPAAGVPAARIAAASRFGRAIATQLPNRDRDDDRPMLVGLGAVKINERLIGSEQVAKRSFRLWGGLLRFLGKPSSPLRQAVLAVYIVFLVLLIVTVAPLLAILKKLMTPFTRAKIARQKAYFAMPSGEATDLAGDGEI